MGTARPVETPADNREGTFITAEMREDLHRRLDGLIDQRNRFEWACSHPEYRRFKPGIPEKNGPKVPETLVQAMIAHEQGLRLISDVLGDEILQLLIPDLDFDTARTTVPGFWQLASRLRPVMPHTRRAIEKHKLVALLWLWRLFRDGRNRKGPKSVVAEAYDLGMDTIPKWESGCRRKLGKFFEVTRSFAEDLPAEYFFELVFRHGAGPKSLYECAEAYRDDLRKFNTEERRGRSRKND